MKYERIKYPDGQISAKITELDHNLPIYITERINSYEDLMFIASLAEAIRFRGINNYHLWIPCLFGQRSDRRFSPMQSFDLKVICDVLNNCRFKSVTVFDPHSDISIAMLNAHKSTSLPHVDNTIHKLLRYDNIDLVLVSPDAGAYKKVFDYGEGSNLPVVAAVKHRDLEGKVDLTFMGNVKDKDCLIVDDLCDGGYTFVKLSEALKSQGAKRVFLYVSHGYFSKGFDELKKNIDHIFCTNSVKDIEDPFITQYKII